MPGKEVLEEGAKAIGWERRNPVAGGNPGTVQARLWHGHEPAPCRTRWLPRRRRRLRLGSRRASATPAATTPAPEVYNGEIVLNDEGNLFCYHGQPDSGTNHDTSMSIQVGEILGYTKLGSHSTLSGATPTWFRSPPAGAAGSRRSFKAARCAMRRTSCARTCSSALPKRSKWTPRSCRCAMA